MDTINWLKNQWLEAGLETGDVVLLHSNIKRTLMQMKRAGYKPSVDALLDSFLAAIGDEGTLILPLFNFSFPTTKHFDIRNTPSQMGALTEAARCRDGAVRTGHPIYSFAVLGAQANSFKGLNNKSGYGKDSPFGIVHKLNGKIASLDLEDQNSMTFYHYVEEALCVDYRYFKEFSGEYIDAEGITTQQSYKLYVRDLERQVVTHVNPAGELMWEQGLYKGFRPGSDVGLRYVRAQDMYDFVAGIISNGKAENLLFRYGETK